MKVKLYFLSCACIGLLLSACIKKDLEDLEVDQWQPEIAVPLIHSDFVAKDLIDQFESNGLISTNDDNIISIVYTGDLFKVKAQDLLTIPELPYHFPSNSVDLSFGDVVPNRFQTMKLNTGTVSYQIELDYPSAVDVEWVIPSAKRNNEVFFKKITIPFTGNSNLASFGSFDLDGYEFDFSGPNGTGFNEFEMQYTARDSRTGEEIPLNVFRGTFEKLKYNLVTGFFEELEYELDEQELTVDIFENFERGRIVMEDPRVRLYFANTFGIPATADLTSFRSNSDGRTYNLSGSFFNKKIEIGYPDIANPEEVAETNVYINNENSDIRNFVALTPGQIDYSFQIALSANQNNTNPNFIRDSSIFIGQVELELPFNASLDQVELRDTFNISFDEVDEAERVEFKLLVENSFPIDVGLQMVFLDSNEAAIDSLLPKNKRIFESATPNSRGEVSEKIITDTRFEMDASRFSKVKDTQHLTMKLKLVSAGGGQQSVKFLSSSELSIKLGVIAKLKNLSP